MPPLGEGTTVGVGDGVGVVTGVADALAHAAKRQTDARPMAARTRRFSRARAGAGMIAILVCAPIEARSGRPQHGTREVRTGTVRGRPRRPPGCRLVAAR